MGQDDNVIFHIAQGETSHFPDRGSGSRSHSMDENEVFRTNLLRFMAEKGMDAANLSRAAKLNPRAVKDIEERRAVSPKISTVFALARALRVDPCELLGTPDRQKLAPELAEYLSQYSEEDQRRLLSALASLPQPKT